MKKTLFLTPVLLLLSFSVHAEIPFSKILGDQLSSSVDAELKALGEITLAPIGDRTVVIVLDERGTESDRVGYADRVVVFRTSSPVSDLPSIQDVGVLVVEKSGVTVTFPQQGLQYFLSLPRHEEGPSGTESIQGLALATWTPGPDHPLTVAEALLVEQARNEEVQAISAGLFQKNDGTGSGNCAQSMTVTCHDGTSATANCGTGQCAECSCPDAGCGCFNAP